VLYTGAPAAAAPAPAPTELRPMRADAYPGFLVDAVASYAEGNVASGRWPAEGAAALALAETHSLLPAGPDTPDQHLMEIWNPAIDRPVGALWYAVTTRGEARSLFVFQLLVDAAHRRRGHGGQALRLLRARAPLHGASSLALHVFSHNTGALRLYESLGFRTTSVNLRLALDTAAA
jgi:ribosomal protein S18 acetylase RimI-like enzyme